MKRRQLTVLISYCCAVLLAVSPGGYCQRNLEPSASVCEDQNPQNSLPGGGFVQPKTTPTPYVLGVDPKIYTRGGTVRVTVVSDVSFRGIILQARATDLPPLIRNVTVGSWLADSDYEVKSCFGDNDTVIQSSQDLKAPNAQFTFQVPGSASVIISISATVVQDSTTFWTGITADIGEAGTGACNVTDPCNNGTCFVSNENPETSYFCQCFTGFSGTDCDTRDIPMCGDGTICKNGNCIESTDTGIFSCVCNGEYMGPDCNILCEEGVTCQNGGSCSSSSENMCVCPPGYIGTYCETKSICLPDLCENGGTCIVLTTGYRCSCRDNYMGQNCSIIISSPVPSQTEILLEPWWIALICLVGLLLIIVFIAVCIIMCRSYRNYPPRMIGDKRYIT